MLDSTTHLEPRRERAINLPAVVIVLVAALLAIQAWMAFLANAPDYVYFEWGFVPGRFTLGLFPHGTEELADSSLVMLRPWTLVTYALLHGSWTHVIVNCIWLVAFGPPVARRFGAPRFLAFLALTAAGGALAHWAAAPREFFPMIGASAADSGLMAAAARFIFQAGAPLGGPGGFNSALAGPGDDGPASTLRELATDRRALIFIAVWLATNFVFGAGAQALGASEAPVAWVAHVGGFAMGLLAFPLFDRKGRRPQS